MNIFKKTLVGGLVTASVFTLGACDTQDSKSSTANDNHNKSATVHVNTDPKKGWVSVFGEKFNTKRCDGSNLVYRLKWDSGYGVNYSQSIAPNSKECIR